MEKYFVPNLRGGHHMTDNIKFIYLYRDAGNYKTWGEVIFSGSNVLSIHGLERDIRVGLLEDGLFIASQVRIPELFPTVLSLDDHCYHEFHAIEATPELSNDRHNRRISDFISEILAAKRVGWLAFDVYERTVFPLTRI
jgi:hypothetical protein